MALEGKGRTDRDGERVGFREREIDRYGAVGRKYRI